MNKKVILGLTMSLLAISCGNQAQEKKIDALQAQIDSLKNVKADFVTKENEVVEETQSQEVIAQKENEVELPFIGEKGFNFGGGGSCCNASITINSNGNCEIYAGLDGNLNPNLVYSGKFKPIMDNIKVYKENGKVYAAMLGANGKVNNDCMDVNGNDIPCIFEL